MLPEKIQRLDLELACLDAVIPLHEVQVDRTRTSLLQTA